MPKYSLKGYEKYKTEKPLYSFKPGDLANLGSVPAQSGGLSPAEKGLIASAALGAAVVGVGMAGSSGSKTKAQLGGLATGALSGSLVGAKLGSIVPGVGTAMGAGFGAVIGGVTGSIRGKKDYMAAKKDAYLTGLGKRKQMYDSAAIGRSAGGLAVDQARKQYAAATPPMELDVTTMPGVASYDAYKGRTYGG